MAGIVFALCPDKDSAECGTANIVLQDTIERNFVLDCYSDISKGTFLVRGENVLLLGEVVSECAEALVICVLAEYLALIGSR